MTNSSARWLDTILLENAKFRERIHPDKLPVQRTPGSLAVITCMDPRINVEAIGILQFTSEGQGSSSVRVVRTIGAMAEPRSLVIGLFLAGIREIAIVMHTDCGCCLAFSKIDTIIENLHKRLTPSQLDEFKATIGEPFRENLRTWLKAFEDPYVAVKQEIAALKSLSYMPQDVVIHGLVYELGSGNIQAVVNGHDET